MTLTLIIPVFAGWLAGFIVNYLSDVLPATRRLSRPSCRTCSVAFPLNRYFFLQRCKDGHSRSLRAWITQWIGVAAGIYLWLSPPGKLGFPLGMILTIYFGLVLIIDLEHRLILHVSSLFGSILGLVTGFLLHGIRASLIGGLGGLAIMVVLYYLGVLFSKYRAGRMQAAGLEADQEESLGAGDVILVTILGLMLGWPLIWFGLVFGILLGGAVSLLIVLWLVISGKYRENALMMFIPYGPYFLFSAYLLIFFPGLISKIVPG